jgi:hypothetical protein
MNLRELCDTSIRLGVALDVRGAAALQQMLEARRREYEALPEWERPYFDQERLRNPFGDVRIAYSPRDPGEIEVRTILQGINIGVPELLLADRLRAAGTRVDAVISHHTNGMGVAASLREDIMSVNVDYLANAGVPPAESERCINPYIHDGWLNLQDFNRHGPDTAKLLGFPLACIHSPADYYTGEAVRALMEETRPQSVADVAHALYAFPEVQSAARLGVGPRIMSGDASWPAGRIMYKFGGGRVLPPDAYRLLGAAGVNTVLQHGGSSAHFRAAQEAGVALVRLPHAASDNIGINLLLDDVERAHGPLHVVPCNSFERIERPVTQTRDR